MAAWNNLDTYAAYQKMAAEKREVDLKQVLAGEAGADNRVVIDV